MENISRLIKFGVPTEWDDKLIAIRVNESIEKANDCNTKKIKIICATTMYLFTSRFRNLMINTENKAHVVQQLGEPVMSRIPHESGNISQLTLCPKNIGHNTIGEHLGAIDGEKSAFRGTTQTQSKDLSKNVDMGKIRVRYYPITSEGVNMINFDSYLNEIKYDPSFQETLKKLQLQYIPHIFKEEGETTVCRPIPFENIVTLDVVSDDGNSFKRYMSEKFDKKFIKRYVFFDWKSWQIDLEKSNLLQRD